MAIKTSSTVGTAVSRASSQCGMTGLQGASIQAVCMCVGESVSMTMGPVWIEHAGIGPRCMGKRIPGSC